MTTRRQFIQIAVTSGAAVAAGASLAAGSLGSALPLERVVVDQRFPAGQSFARQAEARGVRVSQINGSVHDLWYEDLFFHWQDNKSAVAGITDFRSLFLLEMMAADAGMRIVHRIHHHSDAGSHRHTVFGPMSMRSRVLEQLTNAGADWARGAADIVLSWLRTAHPFGASHSDILSANRQSVNGHTPVSWLIR